MVTGSDGGRAGRGTFFPVFAVRSAGPSEPVRITPVRDPSIVVDTDPTSVVVLPREIIAFAPSASIGRSDERPSPKCVRGARQDVVAHVLTASARHLSGCEKEELPRFCEWRHETADKSHLNRNQELIADGGMGRA